MGKLDKLQPAAVWNIFEKMSAIPRGSGNEAGVMTMFKAWSDERGLAWKEDAVGNLLIQIPATKGLEKAAPVLIQGHVDMVCEKNAATKHDFAKDPIRIQVQGDWVTADGTTLGSHNGIGVAAMLAVQLGAMRVLLRDPEGKTPWYQGMGILFYISGMMIAATALRGIGG